MTEQGQGQEQPDYGAAPGPGAYGPGAYGQAAYGQAAYGQGAYGQAAYGPDAQGQGADPGQGQGAYPEPGQAAYSAPGGVAYGAQLPGSGSAAKGFVASLFDFGFTSFVTPKVVKVVYVLITIVVSIGTLGLIIAGFRHGLAPGLFFLVIVAPLFFFIYLALWRIALEIFMVIFRISDDLRSIRERGSGMNPR
jgi:Domain of unknown function (DUF4282)